MVVMKPLPTTVDCVLFDLDGTLVDTNIDFELMRRELIALATEHGIDPNALANLDILAIVRNAADLLRSQKKHEEATQLTDRAMNLLEEIELRHARNTQHIPFARELTITLKDRGIGVGIVTRNCRKASRISLDMAQIEPDVLVCREDTANHKPHPEPLHTALETLNARADASVMVGDHIMDVQGGKAAGMRTVGLLRDGRPEGFFDSSGPDMVARDLKEVLDAIIDRNR